MRQAQEQRYESRKSNTNARYERIKKRVDELCGLRVNGLRPDYCDVIELVAREFGYAPGTVHRILKKVK